MKQTKNKIKNKTRNTHIRTHKKRKKKKEKEKKSRKRAIIAKKKLHEVEACDVVVVVYPFQECGTRKKKINYIKLINK